MGLVVDNIGIVAMLLISLEVGRGHVVSELLQGVPMVVVAFQNHEYVGPKHQHPCPLPQQDTSLQHVGKDSDLPLGTPDGHLGEDNAGENDQVGLHSRRIDVASK